MLQRRPSISPISNHSNNLGGGFIRQLSQPTYVQSRTSLFSRAPAQQTESTLTFKMVVPSTTPPVQSVSASVPSPLSEPVPSTDPSLLPSRDQKTNGKLMSIPDVPSKSEVESTNESPKERLEVKSFLVITPAQQQRVTIKRQKRIQAVLETPLKNPTAKKSCPPPPVKTKKSKSTRGVSI